MCKQHFLIECITVPVHGNFYLSDMVYGITYITLVSLDLDFFPVIHSVKLHDL